MKAMVIAHAHPDFSVGGAEIAAYNLFRVLKTRREYGESIFLARSDSGLAGATALSCCGDPANICGARTSASGSGCAHKIRWR